MSAVFEATVRFGLKLAGTQFPLFIVPLLVFIAFRWSGIASSLRRNPASGLLFSYFLVVLASRFVLYMSGYPYQSRYFHPITILTVFPIAGGLLLVGRYIEKFKRGNLLPWLVLAVVAASTAKVLHPPAPKKWLKDIPDAIRANAPTDGRRVELISAVEDGRLPFYAKSGYHLLMPISGDMFRNAEIFLADGSSETGRKLKGKGACPLNLEGRKGSVKLVVRFDEPTKVRSLSFLWSLTPDKMAADVSFQAVEGGDFLKPELISSNQEGVVFGRELTARIIIIAIDVKSDSLWRLNTIHGYGFDSYQVFTQRYYKGLMKWLPEDFKFGLQSATQAADEWGGDNVFILFDAKLDEVERGLEERKLHGRIRPIGEFTTHKGEPLSLYVGAKAARPKP